MHSRSGSIRLQIAKDSPSCPYVVTWPVDAGLLICVVNSGLAILHPTTKQQPLPPNSRCRNLRPLLMLVPRATSAIVPASSATHSCETAL
jgi:hypothetical protein